MTFVTTLDEDGPDFALEEIVGGAVLAGRCRSGDGGRESCHDEIWLPKHTGIIEGLRGKSSRDLSSVYLLVFT